MSVSPPRRFCVERPAAEVMDEFADGADSAPLFVDDVELD
jgi:hypothetical protein